MPVTDLRARAQEVLNDLAGPAAVLREDQWAAVEALVVGRRRVLVVQRTGWGKTAVYVLATRLQREAGGGPTVLISPLLALMRNQVEAAGRAGVRAASITSDDRDSWDAVHAAVRADEVDLLLVSPERLNNPRFRDEVLPQLAREAGLVVVDEAHCVSDWGHDFRPDYRRIRELVAGLPDGTPVLATTATANARVTADVAEQLGADALVLRGPLERASLRLGVLELGDDPHRLGWLDTHLEGLGGGRGAGIVYALTVAQAEQAAAFLRGRGHRVLAYTGAMAADERVAAEQALLRNEVRALIATSALGMGYDKPDLTFVVHLGSPQSPVAYYQAVGRAGRATERADVLLLPGHADERVWAWFASMAFPPETSVRQVLAVLGTRGPLSLPALEPHVELSRTRLEQLLKVLDVDGAVRRVTGGWEATGQPWSYDAERYARVAEARAAEQGAMRDYRAGAVCRMRFLREQLDDPGAGDCGRCDVCAGPWQDAAIAADALVAAQAALGQVGVPVEPRKQWPSGLAALGVPLKGRLATPPLRGVAVASAQAVGEWPDRLAALLGAPDAPPPDDVVAGCAAALKRFGFPAGRPAGVLAVTSREHPLLVTGLAERIAALGRMTWLGALQPAGVAPTAGSEEGNAAHRVAAVHGTQALPAGLGLDGVGPLLVVDAEARSRWTLAEVARLVAAAGGGPVVPLVLLAR